MVQRGDLVVVVEVVVLLLLLVVVVEDEECSKVDAGPDDDAGDDDDDNALTSGDCNPNVPDKSNTRRVPSLNPPHKKLPEGEILNEVPGRTHGRKKPNETTTSQVCVRDMVFDAGTVQEMLF